MTLLELLQLLRKKLALVIALPVIFTLATGIYTFGFMEDVYTSEVQLYVLTQSQTSQDQSYATSSDTAASQQLANDIAVIADTPKVRNATAKALGMKDLKDYTLGVKNATTNRVITLTVTANDPAAAARVANEFAKNTASCSVETMGLKAVNIVDDATSSDIPSGPNRKMYLAVAFLAGLFVVVAIVVLMDMLNTTVKSREEAEELFGLPVLGTMPELKKVK